MIITIPKSKVERLQCDSKLVILRIVRLHENKSKEFLSGAWMDRPTQQHVVCDVGIGCLCEKDVRVEIAALCLENGEKAILFRILSWQGLTRCPSSSSCPCEMMNLTTDQPQTQCSLYCMRNVPLPTALVLYEERSLGVWGLGSPLFLSPTKSETAAQPPIGDEEMHSPFDPHSAWISLAGP